jgi:hypothetical protein
MPSISSPPTEGLKAPNTEIVPPEGPKGAAKPTQALFALEVSTMMSAAENPNTGVVGGGVTPRSRSTRPGNCPKFPRMSIQSTIQVNRAPVLAV